MAKSKKVKVEAKNETSPMAEKSPSEDTWKHENDARSLESAAEVMADPERMANAKKFHQKKKKAMKSVDDLIKHRNSVHGGAKAPEIEADYED